MITKEQIRAARALLDWGQPALAQLVGVSTDLISKIENGVTAGSIKTLQKIETVFKNHNIEFLPDDGLKKRRERMSEFRGRSGFIEFMWDVHRTMQDGGGEVCVSNVSEDLFEYWLGDIDNEYTKKMAEVDNLKYKILIKEGDNNFSANKYAEYRWIEKERFSSVPFYVYKDKMALILFKEEVIVFLIDNHEVAEAQRLQFEQTWDSAKIPE